MFLQAENTLKMTGDAETFKRLQIRRNCLRDAAIGIAKSITQLDEQTHLIEVNFLIETLTSRSEEIRVLNRRIEQLIPISDLPDEMAQNNSKTDILNRAIYVTYTLRSIIRDDENNPMRYSTSTFKEIVAGLLPPLCFLTEQAVTVKDEENENQIATTGKSTYRFLQVPYCSLIPTSV
jgi:hypothetical protein